MDKNLKVLIPILIVILVIVLVVVLLPKSDEDKIVGTWVTESGWRWTFTEDTIIKDDSWMSPGELDYELKDGELNISYNYSSGRRTIRTHSYRFEGNDILILCEIPQDSDTTTTILYRVK